MKQILLQLKCPKCFHVNLKVAETIVNPNIEADLKRQILEDEFFQIRCRCHEPINFIYPCVYVDKTHSLILYMKETVGEIHDETCNRRLVHTASRFKEMIRIADARLDDRAVGEVRAYLCRRFAVKADQVYFLDRDHEYLWFMKANQPLAVPMSAYEKIVRSLPSANRELLEIKD